MEILKEAALSNYVCSVLISGPSLLPASPSAVTASGGAGHVARTLIGPVRVLSGDSLWGDIFTNIFTNLTKG